MPDYFEALIDELRIVSNSKQDINLHSIYFGGGTPSIIPLSLYQQLFDRMNEFFHITPDCEISIESNPSTLSTQYLKDLKQIGFNRISLGVQSTNDGDLARLDRTHNVWKVLESVENIRKAGFDNLSLDLIFGLPWQDLFGWKNVLSRALVINPEHFSIYSLIVEPGTPFYSWYNRGLIKAQDQDLEADMYELTIDLLAENGYEQYEISNWNKADDKRDLRCCHNMQYWLGYPYLGIGAGAHGFAAGCRTINTPTIEDYIKKYRKTSGYSSPYPRTPSQISFKKIDLQTQMKDFMMVGLRLTKEGVSEDRFFQLFGKTMKEVFREEIARLIQRGLITWENDEKNRLHLTKRGVMVANQAFMAFV